MLLSCIPIFFEYTIHNTINVLIKLISSINLKFSAIILKFLEYWSTYNQMMQYYKAKILYKIVNDTQKRLHKYSLHKSTSIIISGLKYDNKKGQKQQLQSRTARIHFTEIIFVSRTARLHRAQATLF